MIALKRFGALITFLTVPYVIWWAAENFVEGLYAFIILGCLIVGAIYSFLKEFRWI